jgi:hypothetical protein
MLNRCRGNGYAPARASLIDNWRLLVDLVQPVGALSVCVAHVGAVVFLVFCICYAPLRRRAVVSIPHARIHTQRTRAHAGLA